MKMKKKYIIYFVLINIVSSLFSQEYKGQVLISDKLYDSDFKVIENNENDYFCLFTSYEKNYNENQIFYEPEYFKLRLMKISSDGGFLSDEIIIENGINGYQIFQVNNNIAVLYRVRNSFDQKEETCLTLFDSKGMIIWHRLFRRSFFEYGVYSKESGFTLIGAKYTDFYLKRSLMYDLTMIRLDSLGQTVWEKTYEKTRSLSFHGDGAFGETTNGFYFLGRHYLNEEELSNNPIKSFVECNVNHYYYQLVLTDNNGNVIKKTAINIKNGYIFDCLYKNNELFVLNSNLVSKNNLNEYLLFKEEFVVKSVDSLSLIKYDSVGNVIWTKEFIKQEQLLDFNINCFDDKDYCFSIGTNEYFEFYKFDTYGNIILKKEFLDDKRTFSSPKIFIKDNSNLIVYSKSKPKGSKNEFYDLYYMNNNTN